MNSDKINDVYWRVSIRHVSSLLSEVCQKDNYTVLTHKNIMMDSVRMKESYIYVCDGAVHSVLNARSVVSAAAVENSALCRDLCQCHQDYSTKIPFFIDICLWSNICVKNENNQRTNGSMSVAACNRYCGICLGLKYKRQLFPENGQRCIIE